MPPEEAQNAAVPLRAPTHPLVAMVDLLPKPAVVRRGDDLYVNPATCELTGFRASELATVDQWFKTLYGQRHLAMRLIYERHRRAEDKSVTVMPLTCRDGTHCYVELALSRQGDTEVWLLSDVTERVTSDERFRLLFELSADAHFLHDDAGVIDCNRAAIEITGSGTKSRLIGARLADLLEPDTGVGAGFEAMAALARANGHHRCDARLRTTGGSTVPVEVTLTSVQLAGRAMLLAVLHDLTERNKSADALRASEERFRQIAEAAGEYIWEIDAGGCYRFASVRIADVLGRPVDEVVGREMFDFVVDEDRALLRQWFEGIRHEKGAFRDVELRSVRPDGAVVRRRESGQPIIGADGALLGFRGVGQDITRLHAAEIDRMRTEARFRELIEGSIQGIVIHRRFKPLFANKAFADMYGFGGIEAVLAEPDIFPMICEADDDGEGGGYEQIWQRQLARRQPAYPGRRQVRRRDGAEMWVDVLPRPIDWMGEPALQVTVIDATQKHLAEQAVQRVERHLSDAVESINEGFALWDAADRLVMCNQRFRRLRPGYESLAVPGASVLELAPLMTASCNADTGRAVPDWVAARRQTLDRDQLLRCEEQIAGRWYMISERRTADGGVVGVYSDIDALKRNEEKLRHNEEILNHYIGDLEKSRARVEEQSQRLAELAEMYASERTKADAANEAKSHFLAMMSHELRTPMTGVKGMIDLLQRTTLSKEQDRYVDTLRRSADALLTLLNDILDYSKIEAGRLTIEHTDFDLHGLCDEVLALFADRAVERSTVLRPRIAPDVPATVVGDPTRLRQILSNLVGNAVKFTEKGFIEVRFARDAVQGESGLRLRIEVEDTGIGLNEDQIARLFNAFVQADASTTRKYGGTGLGLAICRRLVEAMHGEIGVSSTPGEGSTFWFTMLVDELGPAVPVDSTPDDPAAPGGAPAVEQTAPAAVPSNRIRVLLAEDNPVNRMLIVSMLTGMGYQVDAVENGLHAVRQIERDPAYDLVLMDMQMPEMDGPTATKVIRDMGEPTCRIPIIALTANASPDHRKGYLKAGLDEVLTKPIEWSRLDQVLRMLVARPPADGTGAEPAAEPAPPPPGLFDRRTLRQLAAAMGSQSLKEMVVLMLVTAEQSMNDLRQAHADGNRQLVGDVAHCLKGVASNFGAVRVAELAAVLQHPERSERPVDAVIADLEQAVAQTSDLIATDFDGLLADQAA